MKVIISLCQYVKLCQGLSNEKKAHQLHTSHEQHDSSTGWQIADMANLF